MINDKGEPKIADFGVASQITGLIGNDELAVGTPLFMCVCQLTLCVHRSK